MEKECVICGTIFKTYPSIDKKTCSKECLKILQSINSSGENNPNFGNKWSEEQKQKFSEYQLSISDVISERTKKSWENADERRNVISKLQSELGKERIGELNPFYGKKHTEETKNKIKTTFEEIGRKVKDIDKTDYIIYYEQSNWIEKMYDKIENGINLINENGIFNSRTNKNGLVRDHIMGRRYGFNNGLFPEILRHPANCQLITNSENISKAHSYKSENYIIDTNISIVELFEKIKNYDIEWCEHEIVLNLIIDYENGKRWILE